MRIIKKLLQDNKKYRNTKLIHTWDDRINMKKSIGTSPFQLVYGFEFIFPSSLSLPVMKLLQEEET